MNALHLGTFIYRYAGGHVYEVQVKTDDQLHWRCLEGEDQGRESDETVYRVAIRPDIHLLSWVEADGLVVTQVVDFTAMTVNCTLVLPNGERIVLQGTVYKDGA